MSIFWFLSQGQQSGEEGSSSSDSSSSSSSSGSSSSSSAASSGGSDSTDPCDCTVTVTLIAECGVELSGGIAYSIGTQEVNASIEDPCDCVPDNGLRINGFIPPTTVGDGEPIVVTIIPRPTCEICSQEIYCLPGMKMAFSNNVFIKRRGTALVLNRKAIVQRINQKLARLRRSRS